MKKIIIVGAGPAGLTAAYELLKNKQEYKVMILEKTNCIGGISKTVDYNGNKMDMGGHRFFSKLDFVNAWWENILLTQGAMPYDDIKLHRKSTTVLGGPNPECNDEVMLKRNRVSRIYFNDRFYDYPIKPSFETLSNMGFFTAAAVGMSYLVSCIHKRKEKSLEDFYINRFGKKLYSMFFEKYTQMLWGRHPRDISPDWGAQRVKGLSINTILKDIIYKSLHIGSGTRETSLIEEFSYPKYGPGQLWEKVATYIINMGGEIIMGAEVCSLHKTGNQINSIEYT